MSVGLATGAEGASRTRSALAQPGLPVSAIRAVRPRREDLDFQSLAREADNRSAGGFDLETADPASRPGSNLASSDDRPARASASVAFLAQSLAQEADSAPPPGLERIRSGIAAYTRAGGPPPESGARIDVMPPGGPALGIHHALDLAV